MSCPGAQIATQLGTGPTPPILSLECHSDGEIPVTISVPETRVPGDGRPLGIALRDIRVIALDTATIVNWRLRAALGVSTAIVGIWLAVAALAGKRTATAAAFGCLVVALAVSLRRPDWIAVVVYGPSGVITLAAGWAAWLLAEGRRTGPFVLGLVSVASWRLLPVPDPARLLPALWSPHDAAAFELLPWLAALSVITAALFGGHRAPSLAAIATLVAAITPLVLIVVRPLLEEWSLVVNGPDWTDIASPVGGLLLAATAAVAFIALRAQVSASLPPRLVLLTTVMLVLLVLIPWRNIVMDLNGDEPHYYVTGHSIAADGDLELLDDYLDPDYLANTISPTGNIAVDRATSPDRYAALAPTPSNARFLIPDPATGLAPDSTNPSIVVDGAGNREMLPALIPDANLVVPLSGPCHVGSLLLEAASDAPTTVTVRLLDTTGIQRWQDSLDLNGGVATIRPPLDSSTCTEDFAGTLVIDATSDIIAQVIDTASGLRILPARSATTDWLLGPLPRDQYATQEATARIALFNPGLSSVHATVTVLTPHETLLRSTDISLASGATSVIDADLQDGAAVAISATSPIVASATGWLPGGSFSLPAMVSVTGWTLDIPPVEDRDAGLWLSLGNLSPEQRSVAVQYDDSSQTLTVCDFCADMLHIPGDEQRRDVVVSSDGGPIAVAAVMYEERTGALHFDLGLPLLSAMPIRIAGPSAAPFVSAIATILLSIGLFDLLRRIGVTEHHAVWGASAVALLAPLSPYAVRLYTEPLAACIVVWSLVFWDRARIRPGFTIAALLLAGALPLVHGRYTPLAFVLATLAIVVGARRAPTSRRQVLGLSAFTILLVAIVAVSPLAVALRERANSSYFSTEWVPHNLLGILFDRGSGLLAVAPWCLLAIAAGRRLHPLQRVAILLCFTQLSIVALRAGGWQTFGAPARYILPVVPLLALLAVPGCLRLWRSAVGRVVVTVILGWSVVMTTILHWLPLSGYIYDGQYFIDDARRRLPILAPIELLPAIAPAASSNLLGIALLLTIWTFVWSATRHFQH